MFWQRNSRVVCRLVVWVFVLGETNDAGAGECYLRSDFLFMPNVTGSRDASVDTASVVSGRPWHFDGDNPAPWIDPVSASASFVVVVLICC